MGISTKEGLDIDLYQNKGRFLYKYAGSFLENAVKICFKSRFPESGSKRIENSSGVRPRMFEIDCLVGNDAIEIKWRDATTDGDHIIKEHTRLKSIASSGYKPIRIMFYYPNRSQAKKIQLALSDLYAGLGGEYYSGEAAWTYTEMRTGIDLLSILNRIANERGVS
ncbi:ApaLI family restriction endonuclease [Deinococcus xinjiangensis]|uniref:ApaLI family restriction endonuclease n=1 Tax=Deinococcus xinjiangensis TaxID=457454 RepID=UPI003365440D